MSALGRHKADIVSKC